MKLLLVNGNRTESVTRTVLDEARAAAGPGTDCRAVTAAFGADVVHGHAEDVVAAHAVLDAIARAGPCDAVIIAISFDSGLAAARELLDVPVYGITESALATAAQRGRRIGVITFGQGSRRLYEDVFARSGSAVHIAQVRTLDIASTDAYLTPLAQDERVVAAAHELAQGGAEAVAVCGAAVSGIARRIGARVPVPLFDGVACAVARAKGAVRGAEADPAGTTTLPARHAGPHAVMAGLSPELTALFARRGAA
ncbi:MAG: aspartate/glutamate racemase family protein [Burkholderiales bacterium]